MAPVETIVQPLQFTAPVETVVPVVSTAKRGYLRLPNEVIDNVLPTLRPGEAVVLLRLFRLSHGYGKTVCTVGLPTLANSCRLSVSQTRIAVRNVAERNLIRVMSVDSKNGNNRSRGTIYEVLPQLAARAESTAPTESTAPMVSVPNKVLDKKKLLKGEFACAKCKDTGWFYPEGVAKGVKKCEHEPGTAG